MCNPMWVGGGRYWAFSSLLLPPSLTNTHYHPSITCHCVYHVQRWRFYSQIKKHELHLDAARVVLSLWRQCWLLCWQSCDICMQNPRGEFLWRCEGGLTFLSRPHGSWPQALAGLVRPGRLAREKRGRERGSESNVGCVHILQEWGLYSVSLKQWFGIWQVWP